MALHENNPAAIRRDLGEGIAHAVPRGAGDRFRPAPFALIEGDAIQVVLDRGLVRVVGELGQLAAFGIGVPCFRLSVDQVPAVGAPYGVCMHEARIVRSRQCAHLPRCPVVPSQDPARRIEHLKEIIMFEVGHVVVARVAFRALDHGHYKLPVRRNLRHEPDPGLRHRGVLEGSPRNSVLVADGHLGLDGGQDVEPFVVGGAVQVHPQSLAVAGKGMAVGAGMNSRKKHTAAGVADIAQPPGDQWDGVGSQRFDYPLLKFGGHERHIAVEDRRPHRVLGGLEHHVAARNGRRGAGAYSSRNRHGCRMLTGVLLHRVPGDVIGLPSPCRSLLGCQLRQLVRIRDTTRIDFADAHPLARRFQPDCRRAIGE